MHFHFNSVLSQESMIKDQTEKMDLAEEETPLFDQNQLILSDHVDQKAIKKGNVLLKNLKFQTFLLGKDK